ncbi:hypothetical protein [Chondrinema litorale]|uniref:hypothetical protein n=1 Tax=Chondrinema litorale TaxID=2994555 RepID=UPI0025437E02|nr:hypothetical protein [Chondrinema litorale]UZS00140.1 hypothetical protein OQ292_39980 [Chondrinema litorale]
MPLFTEMPYRINIFLSWEGAYRLYLGQLPYKDFGLPMGYAYWLIPTFFFMLFGPFLHTLIKAQIFINILSGIAFWSILKSFNVKPSVIFLSILVFSLSYIFINFWPWYNHTVIVFEFISLAFLLRFIFSINKNNWIYLCFSAFFCFLSIFTKQDGGGMAFMICLSLLAVDLVYKKKIKGILIFFISIIIIALIFISPFLNNGFLYWFNYGQPPHFSRISINDFLIDIFGRSTWIKFYLLIIAFLLITKFNSLKDFFADKQKVLFTLLIIGILSEAFIYQVTSYVPFDNNIFFHSFAFAYIIYLLTENKKAENKFTVAFWSLLIFFWWSGMYWKYLDRIVISKLFPKEEVKADVISKNTYVQRENEVAKKFNRWILSDMNVFSKVKMPEETIFGIERIKNLPMFKNETSSSPKVLNMSELTPLAYELGYTPLINQPLWYHKGVAIFDNEINVFCENIENEIYDLVLFEEIPTLNNFYPEEIRQCLHKEYYLIDSFPAPRSREEAFIEVFIKKNNQTQIGK